MVCYFASWARYRPNGGAFVPENIDPQICTHVNYAFLGVNPDGSLKILDSWSEIDLGGLAHVESLKYANPDLKVLISIGGWNAGNEFLNGIAASSQLRANLIASCISFLEEWGYDGIDIDWQYPKDSDKVPKYHQEYFSSTTYNILILEQLCKTLTRDEICIRQCWIYHFHCGTWKAIVIVRRTSHQ